MKIDREPALSFDDVVLVPQNTDIRSRKFPNTSTIISPKLKLRIPIISSCMTTITEDKMAIALWKSGGLGIVHRYNTIEEQIVIAKKVMKAGAVAAFAIPSNKDFYERASMLYDTGVKVLCVDIAHGDSIMMFDALKKLRKEFGQRITIIAGNAATGEGTKRIIDAGADAVRLGVSGGSVCETRGISGCGFPTLQSVMNAREYMDKFGYYNYCLIADGGIKSSGDITKALGGGAHAVILGQLLAATDETPGAIITKAGNKYKKYEGMACYSEDTEILTENGWKYFYELNKEESVATLNVDTDNIEYKKPINYYSYDYNGNMIDVKSRTINLSVTPNHRMLVSKRARTYNGYKLKFRTLTAEECINDTGNGFIYKKNGNWQGNDKEFFVIPDVNSYHGIIVPMCEWVDFFGFWTAEGCSYKYNIHNNKNHFTYVCSISNNKKELIYHYKNILKGWGVKSSVRKRGKNYELYIYNLPLYNYLSQFGKAHEKFIPQEIKNLPKEELEIMLCAIFLGDGNKNRTSIYTASAQLRDDIYEIAIKCGRIPSYHINHLKGTTGVINGVVFTRNHDVWSVYIGNASGTSYVPKNGHTFREYNGKVYCVEVENNIVCVRRNGLYVWCGNSLSAQSKWRPDKIKEIVPEGAETLLPYKGAVADVIYKLIGGLQSGMTYQDAMSIDELYKNAHFSVVNTAGLIEGKPHAKKD